MIMINLFSVFDPVSYFILSIKWVIIIIIIILVSLNYFIIKDEFNMILLVFKCSINNIFYEIAKPNGYGLTFFIVRVFLYLAIRNLIGLFPYVFTSTAFLNITLGIRLVMWLSFFIIGWVKNFYHSCAHLVPEGSPLMLAPILVLIERVSHLIRPITLAVRLTANIMAGHLIIGLLSRIRTLRFFSLLSSIFFQRFLLILELGVAIIQGFVFRILLLLYALEYY